MGQIVTPARRHDAEPAAAPRQLYRLTVSQFHRMNENGIFPPDAKVELLNGYLVTQMPPDPPHACAVDLTAEQFSLLFPKEWRLRIQNPITLSDSEPIPDVAVVRGPLKRYTNHHPRPRDIGLLVEVADSSLLLDRRDKSVIYARARIPVYWIVNLVDERIEVYTTPRAGKQPSYQTRTDFGRGTLVPLQFGGTVFGRVAVDDLLPDPSVRY